MHGCKVWIIFEAKPQKFIAEKGVTKPPSNTWETLSSLMFERWWPNRLRIIWPWFDLIRSQWCWTHVRICLAFASAHCVIRVSWSTPQSFQVFLLKVHQTDDGKDPSDGNSGISVNPILERAVWSIGVELRASRFEYACWRWHHTEHTVVSHWLDNETTK